MVITTIDPAQAADYLANIKKDAERTRNKGTALQKNLAVYTITPKSTMTLSDVASATSLGTPETFEIVDNSSKLVAQIPLQLDVLDAMNSNHGTVTGTEQYVEGPRISKTKFLKAFDFDGSSYITLANESNFDFDISNPFTILFWAKFDDVDAHHVLIGKGNAVDTSTGFFIWLRNVGDLIEFEINTDTPQLTNSIQSSTVILPNRWYHIACSFAGGSDRSGMKIYINGVLETTGTSQTMTGSALNANPLAIGAESDGGNKHDGGIAGIEIWNVEFNATNVLNHAQGKQINKDTTVTQPATIGFSDVT